VYEPKAALPAASINLNTATASELQRLPRIGPKLAARILALREAHGPFRRVQDLVQVRGIGKKTLARLAPYLVVEEPEE
ncbi:MAG: helix-hairpin-helix domain-containing protein, partial [Bacteroidetes bacterium]|nr:helix-hairpin-helix domain-containing protein [Bacteroidota bacterium]